ncbi:S-adenosyl-L-methionine-dependent methyltransferase [Dipodascopsis uninucleata]
MSNMTKLEKKKVISKHSKDAKKNKQDLAIQETNGSSIVSKRSVERLYYPVKVDDSRLPNAHFFKYFVSKPQRRAPLINRGYWLRMHAIHLQVKKFLNENTSSRKIIINLGCGYDPVPFQYLNKLSTDRSKAIFVDVDYPDLISRKIRMILDSKELVSLISPLREPQDSAVKLASDNYYVVACDLSKITELSAALKSHSILDPDCDVLFIAEVSLTYMNVDAADNVIKYAASIGKSMSRFVLLEQIVPDGLQHPFARTMVSHFNRLLTPIRAIEKYKTSDDQIQRFRNCGWSYAEATDLQEIWKSQVTSNEKRAIESIEPFDEWEEFYFFCQHYVILIAESSPRNHVKHLKSSSYTNRKTTSLAIQSCSSSRRRWGSSALLSSKRILYVGGLGVKTKLESSFLLTSDPTEELKIDPLNKPCARMCHTIVSLNNSRALICGGRGTPGMAYDDTYIYDDKLKNWQRVGNLPEGRYRHATVNTDANIVLFGGYITGLSEATSEWLKFDTVTKCWQSLRSNRSLGYRLSPGMCWMGSYGLVFGGCNIYGDIYDDVYSWRVVGDIVEIEPLIADRLCSRTFGRLGANVLRYNDESLIIVGGVSENGLLKTEESIVMVNLTTKTEYTLIVDNKQDYPMLNGSSVQLIGNSLIVIGGGAVCFSFGACWNELSIFDINGSESGIQLYSCDETQAQIGKHIEEKTVNNALNIPVRVSGITEFAPKSIGDWLSIYNSSSPAIVRGAEIGPCKELWTAQYLKDKVGRDRNIVVHAAESSAMSFEHKNFSYVNMTFGGFIDQVYNNVSKCSKKRLYLRSLSSYNPKTKPANIYEDFPEIADDFLLPADLKKFIEGKEFSSPLRISSPDVGMWLHYDVTANVLVQVQGSKRVRLYPPTDVSYLSFPAGSSSSTIMNIFDDQSLDAVSAANVHPYESVMHPGDILFIPSMWLHATLPLEPSISINTFWKDLDQSAYSLGKDVYGNRDLKTYEDGRLAVKRIIKSFDNLPDDIRKFYISRLSDEMKYNMCN